MSKTKSKMLDYLQSDEGRKSAIEFFQEIENAKQRKIKHFESELFHKQYDLIYKYVKENGRIDDTDLYYRQPNPLNIGIESEEFIFFTDSITENVKKITIKSDFPKYLFQYKALDLYEIHGQGTYCWIEYNLSNDRNEKLNTIL